MLNLSNPACACTTIYLAFSLANGLIGCAARRGMLCAPAAEMPGQDAFSLVEDDADLQGGDKDLVGHMNDAIACSYICCDDSRRSSTRIADRWRRPGVDGDSLRGERIDRCAERNL